MSSAVQFNVEVSEIVANSVANATKECIRRILETTSLRHGFDLEAELQALGLDSLLLVKKPMGKKSADKVEKVEKEKKSKPVVHKSKCPMPFTGEVVEGCCGGLTYNRGLFTQCLKKHMDSGRFCEKCQSEADKNASGQPDCGTFADRLITGLYAFKDPKGRSPEPYIKVLEKMKMSPDTALEEAGKLDIRIQSEHFTFTGEKKAGGGRGRPKKAVAVAIEGDNATDLFANITPDKPIEEVVVEEVVVEKAPSKGLSEEEKAKKKEALLEQRALQKAELDKKKAQEKEAEKAKKEAEKEAEKAKKEAEKEAKKAEKEAEKAKKEAEKEAKKSKKETKKPNVVAEPVVVPVPEPVVVTEPEPVVVKKVTRIQVNGKSYLKSSENVLYDPATKEEVGIWDPETKTMKDLPEAEEDEDEVVSDKDEDEDEDKEEDEEEYEN
jgi:hypothetical protein